MAEEVIKSFADFKTNVYKNIKIIQNKIQLADDQLQKIFNDIIGIDGNYTEVSQAEFEEGIERIHAQYNEIQNLKKPSLEATEESNNNSTNVKKTEQENDAQVNKVMSQYPVTDINDVCSTADIGDFEQGSAPHCPVLSTLKAMASTTEGQAKIKSLLEPEVVTYRTIPVIEDGAMVDHVIQDGEDISKLQLPDGYDESDIETHTEKYLTVTIQGKKYKLSEKYLNENIGYFAKGDVRVRAIEHAMEQYCNYNDHILTGMDADNAYSILFGDGTRSALDNNPPDDNYISSLQNNKNMKGVAGHAGSGRDEGKYSSYYAYTDAGEPVPIFNAHQYSVIDADSEYVYIRDSHNSSVPLKMKIDDFKKCFEDSKLFDTSK